MPLSLIKCLSHTSFVGYIAAFSSNSWPAFGEIFLTFYYYSANYIDQQTVVPSFWFRLWRPGFLLVGLLYDVGMLGYCIYTEDIFVILITVRLLVGLDQLYDQFWLIKNWIPFFVQREKRKFIFVRAYIMASIWYFVVGSTIWSGHLKERQYIFGSVYYISMFLIIFVCGLPYLIYGGFDLLVKYRLHWYRNVFALLASSAFILGVVGLIIGDGGGDHGNSLIYTLDYHSVYIMIFFVLEFSTGLFAHYFTVIYEEMSWKYPNNPISSPITTATFFSRKETRPETATSGFGSNKVVCSEDISSGESARGLLSRSRSPSINNNEIGNLDNPLSSIKFTMISEGMTNETVTNVSLPPNHLNDIIPPSYDGKRIVAEEDENDKNDLESRYELTTSQAATLSVCDISTAHSQSDKPLFTFRFGYITTFFRPFSSSTKFDGNTAASANSIHSLNDGNTEPSPSHTLENDAMTPEIMMVLKRHEAVVREVDKLCCIGYQMFLWETVMWLAQIFLALYLQSVNTPTPPGAEGYYCPTPLVHSINSAQYANDLFFARKRK